MDYKVLVKIDDESSMLRIPKQFSGDVFIFDKANSELYIVDKETADNNDLDENWVVTDDFGVIRHAIYEMLYQDEEWYFIDRYGRIAKGRVCDCAIYGSEEHYCEKCKDKAEAYKRREVLKDWVYGKIFAIMESKGSTEDEKRNASYVFSYLQDSSYREIRYLRAHCDKLWLVGFGDSDDGPTSMLRFVTDTKYDEKKAEEYKKIAVEMLKRSERKKKEDKH